jgi:hypothetical protein
MRAKLLALPLLLGAGFIIGLSASNPLVQAQQQPGKATGKAPVNRPAPKNE